MGRILFSNIFLFSHCFACLFRLETRNPYSNAGNCQFEYHYAKSATKAYGLCLHSSQGKQQSYLQIFYLLALLCTVIYGGVLPFNYLASNFMINTLYIVIIIFRYFNAPSKLAKMNGNFSMILQLITSVLFIPIIGYCVDIVGKRTKLLVSAAFLGVITYTLFILTYPTLPLILLGITYSIFATVIWPSIALVVKKEIIVINRLFKNIQAVAFGITSSLQNIGIVIFPLIVEFLFIKTKNYEIVSILFIFCRLSYSSCS